MTTFKHYHAKRLLKLADFLDKLPRKKFNYEYIVKGPDEPRKELDCGSVGCAIGWCPVVFPKLASYGRGVRHSLFQRRHSCRTGWWHGGG